MKIVNLDGYTTNPGDLSWDFLKQYTDDVTVYDRTKPEQIVQRAKGAKLLLINKTVLDKDILKTLSPELEYIGLQSTGYNVVDLEAATQLGITVCNIPSYSTDAVAQHVFAMILHFTNQVDAHSRSVRNGDWSRCPDFCYTLSPLEELSGKTLGIIGFGSIGSRVAQIADAFNMNILVCSRSKKELSAYKSAKQAELEEVLSLSDFITCHCPLTDKTNNMINEDAISKMKPSAVLINTSRGPVVDEAAFAKALNSGRIAGAALDVLCKEPPEDGNPILTAKNCVITPHIAWAAKETRARLIKILDENIKSYLNGNPQNKVN